MKKLLIMLLGFTMLGLTACSNEHAQNAKQEAAEAAADAKRATYTGPAESAGQKVDSATYKAKNALTPN